MTPLIMYIKVIFWIACILSLATTMLDAADYGNAHEVTGGLTLICLATDVLLCIILAIFIVFGGGK
jgi:hypothetical protein